ncbi:MAG: helix-turn-helix domain-containing protein [Anaerolineae bacterium]
MTTTTTISKPTAEPLPDLLTLEDLVERLQLSMSTIRRLVTAGEIPAFKLGARVLRVRRSDYEAYLESLGKSQTGRG